MTRLEATALAEFSVVEPVAARTVLSVENLVVGYPVDGRMIKPVDGLSFKVREREVVGLIGDAGSGKSTAALALLGLARAPGKILGGRVEFDGRDLLKLPDPEIRAIRGRDIAIIVQNPRSSLNPMLRIGKQIGYAYQAHNAASGPQLRRKAIDMLRMVGINDPERRADPYAHELSGGMAQRALIAMALSSKPKLLIADEPTSGLDVTIQAQFLDEMWNTVQETGSAILLITQELGTLANYCDRVLVLHEGRIVEDAPVREFFANPQHPYSRQILKLQRERGSSLGLESPEGGVKQLLKTTDLRKTFAVQHTRKTIQAVDKVSLEIGRGETLGLVGESGSGKTTVGRCLLRLLEPTSGSIVFNGEDLVKLPPNDMRRYRSKLQIVFQDPFDSLNPRWTIRRILTEPLDLHSDLSTADKNKRAEELIDLVDLDRSLLDRKPRGLGAGALQRINIARALACNPEFIVLDEPTSVLSPRARVGLIELLVRLQKELGISYLFISHDLTTVRYLCHKVSVMYLGQIVETGTVEQVFSRPRHPYSQALLSAHLFPDPTDRRVDKVIPAALEGEIPSPIDLPNGCYLASRCPHVVDACRTIPQTLDPVGGGQEVRCWRAVAGDVTAFAGGARMSDNIDDVVIVGAGASGAAVAWRLARAGLKVTCLEQGDWVRYDEVPSFRTDWEVARQTSHHPNPNVRQNPVDYPVDDSEAAIKPFLYNAVGGSTILWGAHFPRFRPSDFRVKTLDGVGDDWPISYEDLAPYYEENDRMMGVSGLAGDPGNPPRLARQMPPLPLGRGGETMAAAFDRLGWHWWPCDVAINSTPYGEGRGGCNNCGPCDLGCPSGARSSSDVTYWPQAIRAGAKLITGARVFEIETDSQGRATGVAYYDRDGIARRHRAHVVTLAANGLGTARLMLLSKSKRFPNGIANDTDLVGRRLMHHPTGMVTGTFDEAIDGYAGPFAVSILCQHFYETDAARGFVRGYQMQLVRSNGPVGTAVGGYLPRVPWGERHHETFRNTFARTASLTVTTEDLPRLDNRVTLSDTLTDRWGIPAPKMTYSLDQNTRDMIEHGIKSATRAFEEAGATAVRAERLVVNAGFHLLGTACMGSDPDTSVVDGDCRAHGVPNLMIVDGSVFTTSAALNPTPTIQAVALRAADWLIAARRGVEVAA